MIGVMPIKLWESVFIQTGWDIEYLGEEKHLESGDIIIAGLMPITLGMLANVRKVSGLAYPVLVTAPLDAYGLSQEDAEKKQKTMAEEEGRKVA